jgi:hypothetical protein
MYCATYAEFKARSQVIYADLTIVFKGAQKRSAILSCLATVRLDLIGKLSEDFFICLGGQPWR